MQWLWNAPQTSITNLEIIVLGGFIDEDKISLFEEHDAKKKYKITFLVNQHAHAFLIRMLYSFSEAADRLLLYRLFSQLVIASFHPFPGSPFLPSRFSGDMFF